MSSCSARTAYAPEFLATSRQHAPLRVIEGGKRGTHSSSSLTSKYRHSTVFCIALLMVFVLGTIWRQVDAYDAARVGTRLDSAATEVVTVMPGDSLWSIAERHSVSGCTTSQVVSHIIDANGLTSAALTAGMQLSVPQVTTLS